MNNKKRRLRRMVIRFKGGSEHCEKGFPRKIFIATRCMNQPQEGCMFNGETVK
jgi:hypothetical protein